MTSIGSSKLSARASQHEALLLELRKVTSLLLRTASLGALAGGSPPKHASTPELAVVDSENPSLAKLCVCLERILYDGIRSTWAMSPRPLAATLISFFLPRVQILNPSLVA